MQNPGSTYEQTRQNRTQGVIESGADAQRLGTVTILGIARQPNNPTDSPQSQIKRCQPLLSSFSTHKQMMIIWRHHHHRQQQWLIIHNRQ